MMDFYFNQTAVLQRKSAFDEYNQPVFEPDVDIACRIDYKRRMIRNAAEQTIISESTLFTDVAIKPDDRVIFDGATWTVISCKPMTMLDGSTLFYEVTL